MICMIEMIHLIVNKKDSFDIKERNPTNLLILQIIVQTIFAVGLNRTTRQETGASNFTEFTGTLGYSYSF